MKKCFKLLPNIAQIWVLAMMGGFCTAVIKGEFNLMNAFEFALFWGNLVFVFAMVAIFVVAIAKRNSK